jgi:Fe-S-cluster-containing hydrogenase component 2
MIFDMPRCGGCRTCELGCSFRHTGEFVPSISSIRILEKEGEQGFCVLLLGEDSEENRPCDGCKDLDIPFCVQYCRESEELAKILKEFLEGSGEEESSRSGSGHSADRAGPRA